MFFKKKVQPAAYGPEWKPVIRVSICTGEKTAGFVNRETGVFQDISLIQNDRDLQQFRDQYSITGEIEKIY